MRKLLMFGGIGLVTAWLGVELWAPGFAERTIADRVAEQTRGAVAVSANVDSFPMATRLLLTGRVNRITVRAESVDRLDLTFTQVEIDVTGIELDRNAIFRQEADVVDIDTGTITAALPLASLEQQFGVNLPAGAAPPVEVIGHRLVIGGSQTPVDVPIPDDLFPCQIAAEVSGDVIRLSCTITEVPPALVKAAQGR